MCRQVGLARKDNQPCIQEQYNPSIWWTWWAWRLQVEKAAGVEIPEGEARTGGAWERACTAGSFLASEQGKEGESLQG